MSASSENKALSRRSFVGQLGVCAAAALGTSMVAGCATTPTILGEVVESGRRARVSLSVFRARAHEGLLRVDVGRRMDPIVLMALPDEPGQFRALSSTCTHLGCQVRPRGRRLHCPCHGATFDFEGEVLRGPATRALHRFDVEVEDDVIWIDLTSGM